VVLYTNSSQSDKYFGKKV